MSRTVRPTCQACRHPARKILDAQLLSGASAPELSVEFGLPEDALRCHRQEHVRGLRIVQAPPCGDLVDDIAAFLELRYDEARKLSAWAMTRVDFRTVLAANSVAFRNSGSPLQKVKWLQREAEHTAAMAEHRGNLSAKLKALHELGRFVWLEDRLRRQPIDVTPEPTDSFEWDETERRVAEARRQREEGMPPIPPPSPEVDQRLERAFERSRRSYSARLESEGTQPEDTLPEKRQV